MNFLKTAICLVVAVLIIGLIFYLWLPPINLTSPAFWSFAITSGIILTIALAIAGMEDEEFRPAYATGISAIICLVVLIIGSIVGSSAFQAKTYYNRLDVETTKFENEFANVNWESVPQVDSNSSKILGARKMGELVNEVSQYDISENYTLTNQSGKPIRVAPLEYINLFKYWGNKSKGIPGYVSVDCVAKTAEFVRLDKGIQYSPSAFFSKDLERYLRYEYLSTFFDEFSFEIDDEGKPYYVVSTYKYAAGFGGAKTPSGCIIVDPITGDSTKYSLKEVPEWVDHSITDELAVSMINSWGKFEDGWWNSWIGQKNVRTSTEGNNFITINNDVYLYTGITSVALDESNIGFILVNMRNAEAKYFNLPSAEEYSAMDSARGKVQHLNYVSTFPILINLDGHPTYFLSLKDGAGLIKMIALVSVEDIQKLAVVEEGQGIEYLVSEYRKALKIPENVSEEEIQYETTTFTITNIYSVVIGGNTQFYFTDTDGNVYMTDITKSIKLPMFAIGDKITVKYSTTEIEGYFSISSVE